MKDFVAVSKTKLIAKQILYSCNLELIVTRAEAGSHYELNGLIRFGIYKSNVTASATYKVTHGGETLLKNKYSLKGLFEEENLTQETQEIATHVDSEQLVDPLYILSFIINGHQELHGIDKKRFKCLFKEELLNIVISNSGNKSEILRNNKTLGFFWFEKNKVFLTFKKVKIKIDLIKE